MGRSNNRYRQDRQEQAKIRQSRRDGRSVADQLKILDNKLGKGVGAKKERARLAKFN